MNRLLASEMAKRVRVQRVIRQYDNINRFMHSVEEAFIASGTRPIAVIISRVDAKNRLRVLTPDDPDNFSRDADLGELQQFVSMLGYPSNCFRCSEGNSGEHYLQMCLPHPLS